MHLDDASRPASPSPAAPAKQTPAPAPAATRGTQKAARGGPASRGGRYYQRGGKSSGTTPDAAATAENAEENANAEPRKRRGKFSLSP